MKSFELHTLREIKRIKYSFSMNNDVKRQIKNQDKWSEINRQRNK